MRLRRHPLVLLYAVGSLLVVLVLCILTVMVVRQQRAHAVAVADALYHENIRTALWRMDTRVGTLLATTTNRQRPPDRSASSYASAWIDPQSNRLTAEPTPAGELQARTMGSADRAFESAIAADRAGSERQFAADPAGARAPQQMSQSRIEDRGAQRTAEEFERRQGANVTQQLSNSTVGADTCSIGPLAPVWERGADVINLHMTRRLEDGQGAWYETYRLEWADLERTLLAEVRDLFPVAQLVPIDTARSADPDDGRALRLATIPVRLVAPAPLPAEGLPRTHLWTIAGAWIALLFALVAGALALRSSHDYAEKHRRFTHAVTHELRTPLTTFRMYSEMLARGMAPEASRAEYLATLEAESGRLSRLVDNVLRYARLEDGQAGPALEVTDVAQVVDRCAPELVRTCATFAARLEVLDHTDSRVRLRTDADAVLQILSNLVENACKYGRTAADNAPREDADDKRTPVVLKVQQSGDEVHFDVSDSGPGVPSSIARAIFEPFDRGGRDSSDRATGVGLGLALARALARELGGSLTLQRATRGATFRLSLPIAS